MEIVYTGGNGLKLGGKNLTIAIEPSQPTKSDVTLHYSPQSSGSGLVIDGPGEYEVKGANIVGLAAKPYKGEEPVAIYLIHLDDVSVAAIGNVAPKLDEEQLDRLGPVDVLVLPVGGTEQTLSPAQAAEMVSQVEPRYVVPVYFDDGKTKYDKTPEKIDAFLKEMGATSQPQPKLKFVQKDLPVEMTVAVLEASN